MKKGNNKTHEKHEKKIKKRTWQLRHRVRHPWSHRSQTLFGNAVRETLFPASERRRLLRNRVSRKTVPKQSLGTSERAKKEYFYFISFVFFSCYSCVSWFLS